MGPPDGASHARPCLLESQDPLDVVSVNLFARDGVDDRRLDPEEGKRCTTGLGRGDPRQRRDHVGPGLGLPVRL